MHQELINFTENLVRSLVKEPDMVKVQEFLGDDEIIQLEIIVHEDDMGTIIGKGGKMLKKIGTMARQDIERLLGDKVFLQLWVKVVPDWRDKSAMLKDYGYRNKDY